MNKLVVALLASAVCCLATVYASQLPSAYKSPIATDDVTFIAVGDMPYSDAEEAMLTAPNGSIVKAIKAVQPQVLIHFGDLKSGGTACDDKLLLTRRDQLFHLWPHKVLYTPGDNDWTDCDRPSMRPRFNELERLDFLREHFFSGNGSALSSGLKGLERQPKSIENALWQAQGLAFATINIPGTNNGRNDITVGSKEVILQAAERRDNMNMLWLDRLFSTNAEAMVISFQADIYQPSTKKYPYACNKDNSQRCDGYFKIRQYIENKAAATDKPVLLIHGDTDAYCFHQPVKKTGNLWRLNGLGDFLISDAAKIIFNPADNVQPFVVKSLLGGKALPEVCQYGG